ncbi:MAG: zinc transporter ZntB [Desulfobulbaceae bacterium]|jgi:zinc transporter|nr:zinc transporter ZntB [Desulfobulbaceae bacterium]HKJ13909.1 zinc transporter ZntB [Desulfobulbales bacterium]MDH3543021.1 zinc transporter ZntB [Desulfobulbaceae bacterium]MDH3777058.1 zinc transporter ZntB [Desulfobulbaceae bacterium]MDH3782708.1 zinc transporter ZntB [Desulfobulbaceae bacterium]
MELTNDGLIAAYILDKKGGGRQIGWDGIDSWQPDQGLLWIHFDYSSQNVQEWLFGKSGLEEVISDALIEEDSRPRCTSFQEGLLLGLRGVNLNPGADPEDMVGIRIWFETDRIISTRKRKILSISDIRAALEQGIGPESLSDFLVQLAGRMMERMRHVIDDLEDAVADVEDQVLTSESRQLRTELAALRRQAISLRRYLSPQREALSRLLTEKITWLDESDRIRLREVYDQLTRHIEDLDEARDRAAVTQEQLINSLSEQMNNKMYILSIVAAIFLPLGFLTGLLGINVGGIPGADSKLGFSVFVILLVGVVSFQIWFFKKKKWL